MKTAIYKLVLFILTIAIVVGCSSTKKYKEQNTIVNKELKEKDSISVVEVSKEIKDKLITPVVQSQTGNQVLDSLVNAKVDEILQKLNTYKSSGDNSYSLMYDKLTRQIEFYSQMAQTKNENSKVRKQNDKILVQIKKVPIEIVKPLSRLEKFLMGLGIVSLLFIGFKVVFFIRSKSKILWG